MVILDTSVVSEVMRPRPEPLVVAWLNARPARDLFVTAVTEAEVRTGMEPVLPCWTPGEPASDSNASRARPAAESDFDVDATLVQQPRDA